PPRITSSACRFSSSAASRSGVTTACRCWSSACARPASRASPAGSRARAGYAHSAKTCTPGSGWEGRARRIARNHQGETTMKFGIMFDTHIDKWDLIRYAEELGYDNAWVPDSQMIWSDCYATMALAAFNTKRIRIGTGVAIPGTRIAPVTAHSIATINQLAPGRVFLGIGTGHTAMRVMGQHPMRIKDFREYLRVVRALLHGEAVEYTFGGVTREITFLHRDRHYINLDTPIPIHVAANGPKACEAVGMYGDGWITAGAEDIRKKLPLVESGARKIGRQLPQPFP